jgi:2-amino-4-hydroxy-6-hydroxymethyldihydropteridine diphosphokinase
LKTVYLSLGSNVGNRGANLRDAIGQLQAEGVTATRISPVYETEPVDYTQQQWFLNVVVEAATDLFPMQLLTRVGRIEQALGRRRTVAKGPRTIDIDILLYGNAVVRTPRLEIPHPRMGERRFVLAPLADLAPELRHPLNRRTVREMLASLTGQTVRLRGMLNVLCDSSSSSPSSPSL